MAEAMFNAHAPPGWAAVSAGTRPAAAPNPRTRAMLREIGLDLPSHPPRPLTPELDEKASVRVTMGCLEDSACPAHLRGHRPTDWGLPDPAGLDDEGFRRVRDALRSKVQQLGQELGDRAARGPGAAAAGEERGS